jgi:hypothetical protein
VVSPPARKGSMTFLGWVSVEHFFKRIPWPFAKKKLWGRSFPNQSSFLCFSRSWFSDSTCHGLIQKIKGQSDARSSRLCRVRPLWVLCTQHFPAFLQEAVSRTWTHDLMVTRQQLYLCTNFILVMVSYNFIKIILFELLMLSLQVQKWYGIPQFNLTKANESLCSHLFGTRRTWLHIHFINI